MSSFDASAPRNLVLCCDGTTNQIASEPTNVMLLWQALIRDAGQICYYDPGVGTLGHAQAITMWRRQIRKRLDAAIALSIRDDFIASYGFLVRHYRPGDRVYLFGFSRGAYTARAIAGAIHLFGLLLPEHENLAPYVWRTFGNDDGDEDTKTLFRTAARFRKHFTREAKVHFLGAWDTVSSFGFITRYRTLPYTRENRSIAVVRHAVALDERRACFRANLFEPGVRGQDLREIWFAGYHGDIGGGHVQDKAAASKLALRWMLGEAVAAGLRLDAARCDESLTDPIPDPVAPLNNSMTGWWRLLEFLPQRRYLHAKKRKAWRPPNWFRRRWPASSQDSPTPMHWSTRARCEKSAYNPPNFPKHVVWVDDLPLSGGPTNDR
jgi:uncharacterized protein (DUF2235 family)